MGPVLSCLKSEDQVEQKSKSEEVDESEAGIAMDQKKTSGKVALTTSTRQTADESGNKSTVVVVEEEFEEEILSGSEEEDEVPQSKGGDKRPAQESKPSGATEFTTNPFLADGVVPPELSVQESPQPTGGIKKGLPPRKSRTSSTSSRSSGSSVSSVSNMKNIFGIGGSSRSSATSSPGPGDSAKVRSLEKENDELKKQLEHVLEENKKLQEENAKLRIEKESALAKVSALKRGLEKADTKVLTNKMSVETVIDGDIQYEIITDEDNDVVIGQRLVKTNLKTGMVLDDRDVTEAEVEAILNGEV